MHANEPCVVAYQIKQPSFKSKQDMWYKLKLFNFSSTVFSTRQLCIFVLFCVCNCEKMNNVTAYPLSLRATPLQKTFRIFRCYLLPFYPKSPQPLEFLSEQPDLYSAIKHD